MFRPKRLHIKSFLVLLVLMVILTGCGPATTSPPTQTSTPAKNVQTSAVPPASTPAPAAQPTSQPVKGDLKIHFIDVGQADSILIQTPTGTAILVDGGNNPDGSTIVSYLKAQGVTQLAAVVATHPHEDHIGGLDTVIRAFPVKSVYLPMAPASTRTVEDFFAAIIDSGATRIQAKTGVTLDAGTGITAQFVAPNGTSYEDLNDWSAVLKLTYGGTSFLLTGDAESVSESQMLSSGQDLGATLLKVGHHGSSSSTSAALIKAVSPKYAVVSVGKGNDYGHPAQATLERLAAANVQIYRTDDAGTIVATSDGETIKLDKSASPVKPQAPPTVTPSKPSGGTGSAPVVVPPAPTKPAADDVIVYVTKTGEKYHRDGCRYLSQSKIPMKLPQAKLSYGPCSVCRPPQ